MIKNSKQTLQIAFATQFASTEYFHEPLLQETRLTNYMQQTCAVSQNNNALPNPEGDDFDKLHALNMFCVTNKISHPILVEAPSLPRKEDAGWVYHYMQLRNACPATTFGMCIVFPEH